MLIDKLKKLKAEALAINSEIEKVKSQIEEDKLSVDYTIRDNIQRLLENYDNEKTPEELIEIATIIKESLCALKEDDIIYEPVKILGENISQDYIKIHDRYGLPLKFPRSHFTVVAAPPKIGKTTFMLNIARDCIEQKIPTVFFTNEMKKKQLSIKLLAIEFTLRHGVPYDYSDTIKFFNQNKDFRVEMLDYMQEAKKIFQMCDVRRYCASRICGLYEKYTHILGERPQFVFLDYAQRIYPEHGALKLDPRQQAIQSSMIIEEKASMTNAVWIIGSQQNKDGNTKESGKWEEDCGQLINLSRDKDKQTGEFDPMLFIELRLSRFYKSFSKLVETDLPSGVIGNFKRRQKEMFNESRY